MKKIKKLTSLLLAMAMAFGLSTAVWAGTITNDGTFINNGTITGGTINGASPITGSGTINGRPMDSSIYNVSFRVEQNWLFIDLTVPTSEAGKNHIVQMYDENDNQIIGQAFGTTPMQSLTPNNAGMYVKWAVFEGGVEVNPDTATPVAKGEFANKLVVATSPSVPTMGTVSVTRTALSDGGYAYKVTGLDTTSGGTTIRNGWLRCPNSTGGSAYLRLTDGQVMSDGSFTTCYPCVEQITQNTDGSYAVTWYESSEPVTVEAETSVETAYLLDYGASTGLARTWLGLLLYLDGTEVEAELSNSEAELAGLKGRPVYMSGDSTYSVITNTGSGLAGSSYNKANGTLTLTAVESSAYGEANTANLGDAIATTGAVNINMPNSSASVRGNANTIFLMRETDTDTVDVYTGIRNVPNVKSRDNTVVSAMLDSNGYATSVLIVDGDLSNTGGTIDATGLSAEIVDNHAIFTVAYNGETPDHFTLSFSDASSQLVRKLYTAGSSGEPTKSYLAYTNTSALEDLAGAASVSVVAMTADEKPLGSAFSTPFRLNGSSKTVNASVSASAASPKTVTVRMPDVTEDAYLSFTASASSGASEASNHHVRTGSVATLTLTNDALIAACEAGELNVSATGWYAEIVQSATGGITLNHTMYTVSGTGGVSETTEYGVNVYYQEYVAGSNRAYGLCAQIFGDRNAYYDLSLTDSAGTQILYYGNMPGYSICDNWDVSSTTGTATVATLYPTGDRTTVLYSGSIPSITTIYRQNAFPTGTAAPSVSVSVSGDTYTYTFENLDLSTYNYRVETGSGRSLLHSNVLTLNRDISGERTLYASKSSGSATSGYTIEEYQPITITIPAP